MESLTFEVQKIFCQASERVKSLDFHPTKPWILASLYSGTLSIWNYSSKTLEKSFKITDSPVRSAKFIAHKEWIVAGSDDKFIRVYNFEKMEMIKEIEAHTDFIRCVVVHPTLPYVLSSSDDKLIKLWDWEKNWVCAQTFEGHSHYVMQVAINPKETNTFASASLDGTIKIWNFEWPVPKFTLDGQSKGLNCVDYFADSDKSYLIAGSDDYTAKVWNYEAENCIQTLEGHTNNVTSVCVHPELPVVITASEDGTICMWHANTYRKMSILNYGFGRVWAIGSTKDSDQFVFGCDSGTVMVKINSSNSLDVAT